MSLTKLATKKEWVDALRSGNYKQGKGYLRSLDNKFDAMGVLLDISGVEWLEVPHVGLAGYNIPKFGGYCYDAGNNDKCYGSLGVATLKLMPGLYERCNDIVRLNDYEDKSFEDIADYIEGYLY